MRWYGPTDPVRLQDIAQAGCTGVVSALHDIAPGEVWPLAEINQHKSLIAQQQLNWVVVESLPVHDHIKLGYDDRDSLIEKYILSLRNLAQAKVKVVTYNFMPLLDWLRTDVAYKTAEQSEILYFSRDKYAIFDLFILQRPAARDEYSPQTFKRLKSQFEQMADDEIQSIKESLLMALPGSDQSFTLAYLQKKLEEYRGITTARMRENLVYFLQKICPVADELHMQLAIHPDDPPFSVFGLPRVLSTADDCNYIFSKVPNMSNGLCFCTGSFGARADNDLYSMLQTFGARIYFLHLRNTRRLDNGDFYEANHLEGDADMYRVLSQVRNISLSENRQIPMRPDHGAKILDDLGKTTYPGYSAIGRLKGLAELRGVEYAINQINSI